MFDIVPNENAVDLQHLADELDTAKQRLVEVVDRLGAAVEVPRYEIDAAVEGALGAGRRLREAIVSANDKLGQPRAGWVDAASLSIVVASLADELDRLAREGNRARLQYIADELRGGTVRHRLPLKKMRLDQKRLRALEELEGVSHESVPVIEWPSFAVDSWVLWFANLPPQEAEVTHNRVAGLFPALGEFLEDMDAATWEPLPRPGASATLMSGTAQEQFVCKNQSHTAPDGDALHAIENEVLRIETKLDCRLPLNESEVVGAIPGLNEPNIKLNAAIEVATPKEPLLQSWEKGETQPEQWLSVTSNIVTAESSNLVTSDQREAKSSNDEMTNQELSEASKLANTPRHDDVNSQSENLRRQSALLNVDSRLDGSKLSDTLRRSEPSRHPAKVKGVLPPGISVMAAEPDAVDYLRQDPLKQGATEGPRFVASGALAPAGTTPEDLLSKRGNRTDPELKIRVVNPRDQARKNKSLAKANPSRPGDVGGNDRRSTSFVTVQPPAEIPAIIGQSAEQSSEFEEAPTPKSVTSNAENRSVQAADNGAPVPGGNTNSPIELQPSPVTIEPTAAKCLPDSLRSFEAYRSHHWRNHAGKVVAAPWLAASFRDKLVDATEQALAEQQFARLVLFARAATRLGIDEIPSLRDVQLLLSLVGVPRSVTEGTERSLDIVGAAMKPTLATRFAVFIQAVCPTPARPVAPNEAEKLIFQAGFSSPAMRALLLAGFKLGAQDEDPIARLRNALRDIPTKSPEELAKSVADAENMLRDRLKQLWSAAGGKVERTHCRQAWQEFIAKAQPVLSELLEKQESDEFKMLDSLLDEHEKIADAYNAKFQDRHRMDRAASQLVTTARAVVIARRERGRRTRALQGHGLAELVEAYKSLRDRDSLSLAERAFADLFETLVVSPDVSSSEICGLAQIEFYMRPAILESLTFLSLTEPTATVDAFAVDDPVSAAAHLILDEPMTVAAPLREISRHLREIERHDLLVHVRPMSDVDAKFAATALDHAQVEANRQLGIAQREHYCLQHVGHPSEDDVARAVKEAAELLADNPAQEVKPELITTWLQCLAEFARMAIDESIPHLKESFERHKPTSDMREAFERALAEQRLAHAYALAQGELFNESLDDRATLWRVQAMHSFREPRRILQQQLTSRAGELCRVWLRGIYGDESDDGIRAAFTSFVFERSSTRLTVKEKRRESVVPTDAIRQWIAKNKLNPSFVPQITAFKEVAVITAPVPPTAETFVRTTAEAVARGADGRIVLVLAPNISPNMRDALRDELRKRTSKGYAVVDDLDLVRLLNPGGQRPNLLLGILEIVLEQQPRWRYVNPFEMHEGQHTKPEMFVGRKDEAAQLSTHAQYSRVFSGRRLGKSALLKHIHDAQDHAKLPSGNQLNVVYVPVVGLDGEAPVVEKIIESFATQLKHNFTPTATVPGERLRQFVESYLRAEAKGSVLVFLDEADMFVEDQIAKYETDREKCLTWKMRTEFEAKRDSMDLPRVRFVFAGYRATHRYEGAWANWGDVLRLAPLVAEDAIRLITGPLARLGINATSEGAAIAYRCGYQPAVIVRFGQQLIEYLDNTVSLSRREGVQISPEQVVAVYQSAPVQQEIRTIVWNNFQGNRFGRIIFAGLLLEFARMPPGAALDDAPSRVLHRLRAIVPSFLSRESLDGLALDRVARTLRDFEDRSLVREVQAATQSYQLRFPHQLNVLLQEDQESIIKREALSFDQDPVDAIDRVNALVPRGILDDLALATAAENGYQAVVVVSHWPPAAEVGAADIPTRLGYSAGEIVAADATLDDEAPLLKQQRIAIRNASPEAAVRLLGARTSDQGWQDAPLFVGGLDLLRWSIRQGASVEIASITRLAQIQLRWWFERVRAINFTGANPMRQFADRTAGIPYLVGLLDKELGKQVGFDGTSASEANVNQVLSSYDAIFEFHVRGLVNGDPRVVLDVREQELLVMISRASDIATGASELLEVLVTPNDFASVLPGFARWRGLRPEDALHVDVLFRTGLLPLDPNTSRSGVFDRLGALAKNDPVHRIAKVLERCLSM